MIVNQPKKDSTVCAFNSAVKCTRQERPCAACGWNPNVAKARLDRHCTIHGVTVPEPKQEN